MMKGMDIFCASQAATAIRLGNMDNENDPHGGSSLLSSSSSALHHLGSSGRAIDRYNPIIRDPRRLGKTIPSSSSYSCSSRHSQLEAAISPAPLLHSHQNYHQSIKKVSVLKHYSSSDPDKDHHRTSAHKNNNKKKKKIVNRESLDITEPITQSQEEKRKSIAAKSGQNDLIPSRNDSSSTSFAAAPTRKSWSFSTSTTATPAGSSRYLLSSDQNQTAFFNLISDFDPVLKLEAEEPSKPPHPTLPKRDSSASHILKPSSSSSRPPSDQSLQVVVLRVSLHCKGCERKMRKHISRMEGVSSFNIDFAAKKVTVVGNVTPLGVLASISKVKNAQLWTPAAAATQNNSSEINKTNLNQPPTATATAIVSL